jgi:hypothetical protein
MCSVFTRVVGLTFREAASLSRVPVEIACRACAEDEAMQERGKGITAVAMPELVKALSG